MNYNNRLQPRVLKTEEGDDIHFLVQCLGQGCFFPFLLRKKIESRWREFQFQQNITDTSLLKREENFLLLRNAVTIHGSS